MQREEVKKCVLTGMWLVLFPLVTLAFGPFRPFFLHVRSVNLIWDPLYSFGFAFAPHGPWHNDTHPHPLILLGFAFIVIMFGLLVQLGYAIGKCPPVWRWIIAVIIVASLFVNASFETAQHIEHLHFLIKEIS